MEIEGDEVSPCLPWYNKKAKTACVKKGDQVVKSLALIPGDRGIVLAVFAGMPPLEIPGLRNDVLENPEESEREDEAKEGEPKAAKTKSKKAKKSPKANKLPKAKKANKLPKAKKLPKGWTTKLVPRPSDETRKDKHWVSPEGQEFDRWSQVLAHLQAEQA